MTKDLLVYKAYQGSVEFDSEDKILFGKILFIDSLIMYHGSSVSELDEAFHAAVDDYLAHCARNNKEPNKPYSGGFNVRIGPELHKAAALYAYRAGQSLNEFVKRSIESAISKEHQQPREVIINHIVSHQHKVETTYTPEETSWQPPAKGQPKLRIAH